MLTKNKQEVGLHTKVNKKVVQSLPSSYIHQHCKCNIEY